MSLKKILTYSLLGLTAIGGFFGNVDIDTNLENNSMISFSVDITSTYAATGDTTSAGAVKMYNDAIDVINMILLVLSAMITPIVLFAGWLMSPDWTSGDLFGLRAPMYSLWVTVSNIVYFIYAVLLIMIALGTMFGQDKFSYKVMLPKLALGILMVPFTWWFVQWTVSIASVMTTAVMDIPAETIKGGDSIWFSQTKSIPKEIKVDNTGTGSATEKVDCDTNSDKCMTPKEFLANAGGMYGPLVVYGYSIFKFEKINTLSSAVDIASAALQIVHTSIISTIMFAVFGLIVIALTAMLLVRAIKLWMYAIFAPLFTFRFVAGSNLMGGDDDSFSIKEFIGLAFVPAIVGLTLSFGLIIINAVQGPGSTATDKSQQTCDLSKDPGCQITGIFGNSKNSITRKIENFGKPDAYTKTVFKYADIEFIFSGKATNQSEAKSTSSGAIGAIGGMFGTLIVDVIALVFIWMAFMAAKNVSKAVKMAVQPFEEIGNKIGGLAKEIPKYTPIPGLNISASGISKVIDKKQEGIQYESKNRDADSTLGRWAGLDRPPRIPTTSAMKEYSENITQATTNNVLLQISQESEGLQGKLGTDVINTAINKYITNKDGKIQITDEKALKEALRMLKIDPIKNDKLWKMIETKGALPENYMKNDPHGKDLLKQMLGGKGGVSSTAEAPKSEKPKDNKGGTGGQKGTTETSPATLPTSSSSSGTH